MDFKWFMIMLSVAVIGLSVSAGIEKYAESHEKEAIGVANAQTVAACYQAQSKAIENHVEFTAKCAK